LVGAELGIAVQDDRVAFGSEPIFVGITADAGDSLQIEIERYGREASSGQERDKERAEATVDVERKLSPFAEGEARKSGYVIYDAVRKIRGRSDEKDSVAVDKG